MMEYRHGGNLLEMSRIAGCRLQEILDFSANIHPDGFPDWLRMILSSHVSGLVHYPDPDYTSLREKISAAWSIPFEEIVVGNGASELLHWIPRALNFSRIILPVPSYVDYDKAAQSAVHGSSGGNCAEVKTWPLNPEDGFRLRLQELQAYLEDLPPGIRTGVLIGNPNNPTGQLIAGEDLRTLALAHPSVQFVVDEAFIDFADPEQSLRRTRPGNVIVVWSWTKVLALPGLRMAVMIADSEVCRKVRKSLPTWALNGLAAAVMERAVDDRERWERTAARTSEWRAEFCRSLGKIQGLETFHGSANFLLMKSKRPELSAERIRTELLRAHRIGIRDCSNYQGLGTHFLRAAIRTTDENEKFAQALRTVFEGSSSRMKTASQKNIPALMFQGTGSNVGKSILATALCRILYQDGFKVAPFKAQNMALNSFVTPAGGEIGRAQALQAQAAKRVPDVRMNPVLLKPSNEKGSQVILNGKPVAHMDYIDYSRFKAEAFQAVQASYDSLSSEMDVMILEGAGSASEVNLKKHDIVNMKMARYADARVLLVGNIDHGGVFGAMVGTLETMAEWERSLVAGYVINRFRGVKDLLKEGLDYLEAYTGRPVLGVVPHLKGLMLPEEDSLEFKSGVLSDLSPLGDRIDVALIDLPRISNFTDVDALAIEEDVRVRHVRKSAELGMPDVVILPGSKNVATDLEHLREVGLAKRILELANEGRTEIVGICGGYQMLGEKLFDPHGIESPNREVQGLGLLPLETRYESEKTLSQTEGIHLETGYLIRGYEIHHGVTRELGTLKRLAGSKDGAVLMQGRQDERIWGTYLHGIFDSDEFRRWYLDRVREKKGIEPWRGERARYDLERGIDELASHVRESLDMNAIYRTLGI